MATNAHVDVSLVIPAYNEEARLPPTLRRVGEFVRQDARRWEVVVVDDGSTDRTVEAVALLRKEGIVPRLIRHDQNRGKGAAVRTGVAATTGEIVLFSDADLSAPIEDAVRLLEQLQSGADVAIGSRALDRSLIIKHQPWPRDLMGRCFNLAVQLIVLPGIWDTQCGFKALRGEVARELFARLQSERFAFDVEVLYRARRAGYKIVEVPVHWRDRPGSQVHPLRDSSEMLRSLFRIRRMVG